MAQQPPKPDPAGTPAPAGGAQPGQIVQPNPLEIFWEKNRIAIIAAAVALLAILGGMRLWRYLERQKLNRTWGTLTTNLGWTEGYAPEGVSPFEFFQFPPHNKFADWRGRAVLDGTS